MPTPQDTPKQPSPRALAIARFFNKTSVKIVYGVVALLLAAMMVLIAIDTGSLIDYAICAILIYLGVSDLSIVARRLWWRRKRP